MNRDRRSFFGLFAVGLGVASLGWRGSAAAAPQSQPPRSPRSPRFPDFPPPKPNTRAILKENEKELKKNVQQLFELAEGLKKEVDKTDSTEILSLNVVRTAGEIEKLAKHIKGLALG